MLLLESYFDIRNIKSSSMESSDEAMLIGMNISTLGARYGVSNKLTFAAFMPYIFLKTNLGNDNGLGDMNIMATYNLYSKNAFNIAGQMGIELPTGVIKNSKYDGTSISIGSGSFDPMIGISGSKRIDNFMIQANLLYKKTILGYNGNYYGDLAIQNATVSYQIIGNNSICSANISSNKNLLELNLFGGYYGEWLDKTTEDEVVNDDSGHYLGFVTSGANLSYGHWVLPLSFSIPIVNDVFGDQNKASYRCKIGLVRSF